MTSELPANTEPQVLATSVSAAAARFELRIPENLRYFDGHFPGCAILPGVVQLKWAIDFARRHWRLKPNFSRLSQVKFTRVIVPGRCVTLDLQVDGDSLGFQYRIDDTVCSSGSIDFSV